MHDIAEQYLYSVHMTQHLLLTLILPPLVLLATPEWLARLIIGDGRSYKVVRQLARPVPATLLFNGSVALTHWATVVNTSVENGLFHYTVHVVVVATALLMWMPVASPLPEIRIPIPAQMLYLFVQSVLPTIPGAWLTFAEGVLYDAYDHPFRLWDVGVIDDQQAAGLIMKLAGGAILWTIITVQFFRWAGRHMAADRLGYAPTEREVLTWSDVEREFERTDAPDDPRDSLPHQ